MIDHAVNNSFSIDLSLPPGDIAVGIHDQGPVLSVGATHRDLLGQDAFDICAVDEEVSDVGSALDRFLDQGRTGGQALDACVGETCIINDTVREVRVVRFQVLHLSLRDRGPLYTRIGNICGLRIEFGYNRGRNFG